MLRRPPTRIEIKPEDVEELEAVQQRQREQEHHHQQQQFATAAAARVAGGVGVPVAGVSTPCGPSDTTTSTPQGRTGGVEGGARGGGGEGGGNGAYHTPTVAERIGLRR